MLRSHLRTLITGLLIGTQALAVSTRTLDAQQITNGANTLTVPSGVTTTLVGRSSTDTLTNKTLDGGSNTFTNIPSSAITGLTVSLNDDVGTIFASGSSTVPVGCLLADGSAVSRTTYAALFSKIGTTYGSGNGTTTFNLPNTQGVFVRGAGSQTIGTITYSGTAGTTKGDQMQGHIHNEMGAVSSTAQTSSITPIGVYSAAQQGSNSFTSAPQNDGTNGTPRVGSETAPANIAAYFYIRYLSSGSGGSPVIAAYYDGSNATYSTTSNVQWPTVITDPYSAVTTGSSWKFTVPAGHSGIYEIHISGYLDNANTGWRAVINGTNSGYNDTVTTTGLHGLTNTFALNAGDTLAYTAIGSVQMDTTDGGKINVILIKQIQ